MGFSGYVEREVRLHRSFAWTDFWSVATDSFYGLLFAEKISVRILRSFTAGSGVLSQEFTQTIRVLFAPVRGVNA